MDYKEIGRNLQIERDFVHVNSEQLSEYVESNVNYLPRTKGVELFNEIAQNNGLNPLRQPEGYMTLEGNVYNFIYDTYEYVYSERLRQTNDGERDATPYALAAVIEDEKKLRSRIRKDFSEFMPKTMKYSELRFIFTTDEIADKVEETVNARADMTEYRSKIRKRGHEGFDKEVETFHTHMKELCQMLENERFPEKSRVQEEGLVM